MALTLQQKDTLTTDAGFLGRARQAVREYAKYCEDQGASATQQQKDWASQVLVGLRAPQIAANMAGELVTDAKFANAVQADASDVSDTDFKSAVEAICLKYV